ncbi:TRAP transporter substrate-binding protein [Oscillibacter sp.]|uniref:TRAP transporter substrate-binding protein n=1 Tax=Oscillibacter sp. TaxID=1945593 RepID=UPI0026263EE4|nr:TRAP transporter substrate-binding protein [Oscillibacter sp.]MDD3346193.1 TRAP transporter substrate-binding protein [Oscillibacter sp.]
MKKFLSLVLVLGLSATLLAGCGSKKEEAPAANPSAPAADAATSEEYDKLNIIAAHGASEATSEHASFVKFKELLEERSGGAVTVDLYPNQQLGGDREYTEAATQGNVTMGGPSTANIAPFVPALNAFETPFMFSDRETVYTALDSDAGKALLDSLESAGLKGLGYFENGFRQLTCNKDINSLADLKGLKIRTMENEIHLAIWTALGANPGPLAFGELYTALQQKAFDAQENPAELIYNTKFYEVQNHVYLTNHIYTPYIVYINKAVWDGLNANTQELIQSCMDEAVQYCRQICTENEQKAFDAVNASGKSKTYEVSPELHDEMVAACKDVYNMVIEKAGGTYAEDLWAAANFQP